MGSPAKIKRMEGAGQSAVLWEITGSLDRHRQQA